MRKNEQIRQAREALEGDYEIIDKRAEERLSAIGVKPVNLDYKELSKDYRKVESLRNKEEISKLKLIYKENLTNLKRIYNETVNNTVATYNEEEINAKLVKLKEDFTTNKMLINDKEKRS